jgi:hypothetical protein
MNAASKRRPGLTRKQLKWLDDHVPGFREAREVADQVRAEAAASRKALKAASK